MIENKTKTRFLTILVDFSDPLAFDFHENTQESKQYVYIQNFPLLIKSLFFGQNPFLTYDIRNIYHLDKLFNIAKRDQCQEKISILFAIRVPVIFPELLLRVFQQLDEVSINRADAQKEEEKFSVGDLYRAVIEEDES